MGRIGRLIKTEIEKFIVATVETRFKYNQSVEMYAASGDDAPPLPDDRVLAVETDGTGNFAGAGVLMVSQGAKAGERFIYSRDEDGNVKALIKLLGDGKIEAVAPDAITIKSDKGIEIKGETATLKGKVKATGGSFECGGVVSPTGQGALCGVPYCLFTGAPHCGSKAEGT